jgi:N-hydroxyarylamine O-acetyltransferase
MDAAFDLDAYLRRIGFRAAPRPDLATLRALHRAHVDAIPFENLEIQMGGGIPLDLPALQRKMLHHRRGGYCFEQNTLFAAALAAVGFRPVTCEARVRQGAPGAIRPRTHMVLVVPCDDRQWLADVGFGGDGLMEPLTLGDAVAEQFGRTFRVATEGPLQVLQMRRDEEWDDLYAFLPDPVHPVDFAVANWFTSTFPSSVFVTTLTVQRSTSEARHILRNLSYTVLRGRQAETREIARAALVPLLRDVFGLDIPEDARFRAIDP